MNTLFSLIFLIGSIAFFASTIPDYPRNGEYHYPYKGKHLQCVENETWQMGVVSSNLKDPCVIVDPATGETLFKGVQPEISVFIVRKHETFIPIIHNDATSTNVSNCR